MMNVNSREWMVLVAGFSLLLLVGCAEDTKTNNSKTETPKVSLAKPGDEKMAYAANASKKSVVKIKEEKIAKRENQPNVDMAMKTEQSVPSGTFTQDDHLKPVYFKLHRSKISDEGMKVVLDNATWIKTQPPFLLQITGVADQRGSASRNKTLAEHRALNVKQAYVALGITPERIQIVSLGQDSKACTDLSEDCFQISRRADTKIEEKALLAQR